MADFPTTIKNLELELTEYLRTDQRQDAPFRLSIAMGQIGSLVAHLNHDQAENPGARPYKTIEGEKNDFGHAVLQTIIYGISRNLPLQESIDSALAMLRERDWKAQAPTESDFPDIIHGTTGCRGCITGTALVVADIAEIAGRYFPGSILVIPHSPADARLKKFAGIVTDHGGTMCHAAIVAREAGIPCVVKTGNATSRIHNGDAISILTVGDSGFVTIIDGE
jgi:pyruvate,water dikinase